MRDIVAIFALIAVTLAGCGRNAPTRPVSQQQVQPPAATQTPPATTQAPIPTGVATQAADQPTPTGAAITSTPVPSAKGTIVIEQPAAGTAISSPVLIRGSTDFWPFEATLVARVKDAQGNVLGMGPLMVQAPDIGQGGPFAGELSFTPPAAPQDGTLEVFEASAKDGSIVVIASVPVKLGGATIESGVILDAPAANADITLPLHVAFRGAQADAAVIARLRWSNGSVLEQRVPVVIGTDGVGYGVANLQWNTESAPPPTPPGPATFELVREDGALLQRVPVNVLPEAATQRVQVHWISTDGQPIIFQQAVPRTPQIATAALNELLNGPPDGNLAGATTALPTTQEIVTFAGRASSWGYRVRLLKLTITAGVATANFSQELRAYGGGSARVQAIRQQIEGTLRQFPSVQQVVIQIEGQSEGVLEP
ncbi:Gmad2 immunoglobulin-like domain-containing protein [Kallotenue papyrolyticum]|uniref:Gmad2 immunoglobulin-like domain-containing protein n=1 Tax=Kallotenue papyrolyticum TaxID=1325125 RepID=UPI0004785CEA|nr:Gmad2 immunoglobulin-like domain-containing protein [Kallotenue papyrolyticum]